MALTHDQAHAITGAAWLFGLAALFYTGWWWPGIMIIIGISALIEGIANRTFWAALQGSVWLFGIAIWATFHYSLVVLFIILGVSVLTNAFLPPPFLRRKPKPQTDAYLE